MHRGGDPRRSDEEAPEYPASGKGSGKTSEEGKAGEFIFQRSEWHNSKPDVDRDLGTRLGWRGASGRVLRCLGCRIRVTDR